MKKRENTKRKNSEQVSGVIPESAYLEGNPIRKMTREILAGRKDPYSAEEIRRSIELRYLGFESLVSLTRDEENLLCDDLTDSLQRAVNEGGTLRQFFGSSCYISKKRKDRRQDVYTKEALNKENIPGLRLMTDKEKLMFLEDPMNLDVHFHREWGSSSFAKMGYRNFDQYSMSENFSKTIREIQTVKNKTDLRVLDLGGGIGLALDDIKKDYPELITYNATRDEEFGHYPSDFHVIAFMERMPLALKGSIDIIFSNMATRYLAYTDLVIQCCVSMLAKGGIMDVFFSCERSDNPNENDIQRRTKSAYDFLKDMESSRLIELKIDHTYTSCVGGSFKSKDGTLYPAATVFVRKL